LKQVDYGLTLTSGLRPRADFAQAVIDPELGQLLLRAILRKTRAQAAKIHVVERLILIKA
jgi:hypothetical protein